MKQDFAARRKVCEVGTYVLGRKGDILYTSGIGSCVGVVLWDRWHDLAGMIHVQFPCTDLSEEWSAMSGLVSQVSGTRMPWEHCADPGLMTMISDLNALGSINSFTRAYLAGGSNMFPTVECLDPSLNVGQRNIDAVKKVLSDAGIPVHHENLGGNDGRAQSFDVATGLHEIKYFKARECVI